MKSSEKVQRLMAAGVLCTHPKRRVPPSFSILSPPLLFLLLSTIFLWQPLATGDALLPTDIAYRFDYVWRAPVPGAGAHPQASSPANPLLSDVALYYYPYATYAIDQLKSGDFPLWNPYILAGTPFFASTQAAVLDPVNLLTYTAGSYNYWALGAWLRLALLGTFTYGWARALGRQYAGAVASGIVFMICAFVVAWLNYSVVTTVVWLPALLWATTRLAQTGRPMWVGASGLTMGLLFLGGHPETEFIGVLFWLAFSLFLVLGRYRQPHKQEQGRKCVSRLSRTARRLAALACSGLLGIGVGAVQLLPFVSLLLNSSAIGQRSSNPPLPLDVWNSFRLIAVLLLPNFSGNPLQDDYWYPSSTNFNEQAGYFGLLALVLAVMGTLYWWKRDPTVRFIGITGICAASFAIHLPGFHLLYMLPVFNIGYGVRWGLALSLCGAVLTGYGVDALSSLLPWSATLLKASRLLAATAISGLGVLLVMYVGIRFGGWDQHWPFVPKHSAIVQLFDPTHLIPYWPLLFLFSGAVVLWMRWRGMVSAAGSVTLLIALLYCDLWVFGSQYNPVALVQAVYPPRQIIGYLQQHIQHERFVGTAGTLMPNAPMLFGLRDLRGYEDVIDAPFTQLYGGLLKQLQISTSGSVQLSTTDQRVLQIAGVRYILSGRKIQTLGGTRPYRAVFTNGGVTLYESSQALPRAYVVFKAKAAPDITAAIKDVLDAQNDPSQTVVLIGNMGDRGVTTNGAKEGSWRVGAPVAQRTWLKAARPIKQSAGSVPVTWRVDNPERIELSVTMPAAGYLVLSDSYSPGWRAKVDGQDAPLFRANAVFRAVAVPGGNHIITFTYDPVLFNVGAAASALSLCIATALLLTGLRTRKRNQVES
ncbi:MAG: YfhO family protein [Chloroflexi bacterium]|nr:YfhO family protein [Chloroflexota bacterium]